MQMTPDVKLIDLPPYGQTGKQMDFPYLIVATDSTQTPFNVLIAVDGFTKRCSDARCPLVTIQSSRCKICLREEGVRCERERIENLNLENGGVLEGVRKFRYLGDMLNGEGRSRLASISRVRCGWKKFRELSGILTSKKVALRLKGKVYGACVRSSMIYGSETWAVNAEQFFIILKT